MVGLISAVGFGSLGRHFIEDTVIDGQLLEIHGQSAKRAFLVLSNRSDATRANEMAILADDEGKLVGIVVEGEVADAALQIGVDLSGGELFLSGLSG